MIFWSLLLAASGVSLVLTWALRRYALMRRLIDVPNQRSSHGIPTPRGGGMAIALAFLGSVSVLWALDLLRWPLVAALGGSGAAIALIGFWDWRSALRTSWSTA